MSGISHTLQLDGKERTFCSTDSKEAIVSSLGLPDLDVGNGCCNALPAVLKYGDCEFHFKCEKLKQISLSGQLLKFEQ